MNPKTPMPLILGSLLLAGLFAFWQAGSPPARAAGAAWFAAPGGAGNCSQAAPCTLPAALAAAASGDVVYLARGTYTGSGPAVVSLAKSVALYGGWDGAASGPIRRDPAAYTSSLDGQGQRRAIFVGSGVAITLDGLRIANGVDAFQGGGLYARGADLTIRATEFYSNAVYSSKYSYGGGAFVEAGRLDIEGATFHANSAWGDNSGLGGGLAISHSLAVTITGSAFLHNDAWHGSGLYFRGDGPASKLLVQASRFERNGHGDSYGDAWGGYGGALQVEQAQAQIVENFIDDNAAANQAGAIHILDSSLTLARNVITHNTSYEVGALYFGACSPLIVTNNIIANNQAWSSHSAAIVFSSGAGQFNHNTIAANPGAYGVLIRGVSLSMTNTILAGHTLGISVTLFSTVSLESTLWGAGEWANATDWGGSGTILTGTVNLWSDPAFLSPQAGNYHLAPGSAAIDAGVEAGVADDIDGDPRPLPAGAAPDLGADEFNLLDAPPAVQAIRRLDPNPTAAASLRYRVTFSEIVSGVDAADFALYTTGTLNGAAISAVSGSGATYTVIVSTGTGEGSLRLDLPATATLEDTDGNPLSGLPYHLGDAYTLIATRAGPFAVYLPVIVR